MSKAVWVVSEDQDDANYALAVFKTRQEMLRALESRYPNIEISYVGDLPDSAHAVYEANGRRYHKWFSLQRFKLDDWTIL